MRQPQERQGDQEYKAVIEAYPRWKRAKLACVESILRRFSYEVNTKVGELNLSLSDRLDYWKKLYSDLKADVSASAPLANPAAINGDHYFYAGMMENHGTGRGGGGHVLP